MENLNIVFYHETLFIVKKLALGEIIEGIKRRDNKVLTYIYEELFPGISSYITNHGGTVDDAKDVFQEAIIIIFRQIEEKSLDIKTGFENYIYGIARLIWLKLVRSKDIQKRNLHLIEEPEPEYSLAEELIDDDFELRIFRKHFLEMGQECQKILKLSANDVSNSNIAEMMGYKNEQVVRNIKYKCKEKLIEKIKNDPEYIELLKNRRK
jgi:RNA polymerase sigma factor (sigma-70 family)